MNNSIKKASLVKKLTNKWNIGSISLTELFYGDVDVLQKVNQEL